MTTISNVLKYNNNNNFLLGLKDLVQFFSKPSITGSSTGGGGTAVREVSFLMDSNGSKLGW